MVSTSFLNSSYLPSCNALMRARSRRDACFSFSFWKLSRWVLHAFASRAMMLTWWRWRSFTSRECTTMARRKACRRFFCCTSASAARRAISRSSVVSWRGGRLRTRHTMPSPRPVAAPSAVPSTSSLRARRAALVTAPTIGVGPTAAYPSAAPCSPAEAVTAGMSVACRWDSTPAASATTRRSARWAPHRRAALARMSNRRLVACSHMEGTAHTQSTRTAHAAQQPCHTVSQQRQRPTPKHGAAHLIRRSLGLLVQLLDVGLHHRRVALTVQLLQRGQVKRGAHRRRASPHLRHAGCRQQHTRRVLAGRPRVRDART